MDIFLDTADIDAIRRAAATGLLGGVTTNPSLLANAGRSAEEAIPEICRLVRGPVSVEVMAEEADEMVEEARGLASLAPNIAVKVPMTVEGLKAVPVLERKYSIPTNVTMIFSPTQAFLAMKAGASYVSIVLSRLDAVGIDSEGLIEDAARIKANYGFISRIIGGSVKTQNHVLACLRAGVDIATIPEGLFFQLFRHPLTDAGLKAFHEDWQRTNGKGIGVRG